MARVANLYGMLHGAGGFDQNLGSWNVVRVSNLAAALLDLANHSPSPAEFKPIYDEAEALLLSVLRHDPAHTQAEKNLAVVRQNRSYRLGR